MAVLLLLALRTAQVFPLTSNTTRPLLDRQFYVKDDNIYLLYTPMMATRIFKYKIQWRFFSVIYIW